MTSARLLGWGAALAAVAVLVVLAPPPVDMQGAGDVVQNLPRALPRPESSGRAATVPGELLSLRPRQAGGPDADGRLWQDGPAPETRTARRSPEPAAPVLTAAAPPVAPPPPFRMLGRYADGAKEGVILQGTDGAVLIAHPGETLVDAYRVESVTGNVMVLNYLPLNLRQTMDIGIAR